jgi:ribosome biogenesis GTPase
MTLLRGTVLRSQSGFYTVQTDEGVRVCRIRGSLKRKLGRNDQITVGDRVQVLPLSDGTGVIQDLEPRSSALVRLEPTPRGEFRQVLLANADQIVLVFSCAQPAPRLGMLDRFLVICEKQGIPPLIVANKIDLVSRQQAEEYFALYAKLGYPVLYTSAKTGHGICELRGQLKDRISGLVGPSGAGKTSLLNAIQPELGLTVGSVSSATTKGRHTTVVRSMFPLTCGGYVADLPGLRALALWDTQPEELDGYFPELRHLVSQCQFSDCSHNPDEPGCAVRAAVAEGKIDPRRYESYLRLRTGED